MKCITRITALLLVFGLLLVGCGNGDPSVTDGTTEYTGTTEHTPPTDGTAGDESPISCQYLPETVDNPNNLPVLKWVCLTHSFFGGGNRTWNEEAAVELNQMLADRNMPFRVQFVLLTNKQYMPNTQDWFAVPEAQEALKDVDLIYAGMNQDSITKYLAPITEYVTGDAQPSLKNAVPHQLNWLTGTVGEEIYGYNSTALYCAYSNGWMVDPALLQAAEMTPEALQRDFWEMDDVFAKLYEANGNKPFLYLRLPGTGSGSSFFGDYAAMLYIDSTNNLIPQYYNLIGSFFAVDYSRDTPVIVNYPETTTTQKIFEAAARYTAAGYSTKAVEDVRLQYTSIYGDFIHADPRNDGKILIPVTDAYFTNAVPEGFVSGVAAVSQHKNEAVSLLSLIGQDEAFRMQLFYGKEDRDYQVADGYYEMITREDGSNYSLDFLSPLSYFCGLTANPESDLLRSPGTNNRDLIARDGKTALQTYQEIMDNSVCGYPIRFDFTGYEQELAAIEELFQEKYAPLFRKNGITEAQRQQFVSDLKAAGSDKILAELQRQLTQWQAAHPDQ